LLYLVYQAERRVPVVIQGAQVGIDLRQGLLLGSRVKPEIAYGLTDRIVILLLGEAVVIFVVRSAPGRSYVLLKAPFQKRLVDELNAIVIMPS
jgi:hypothetical protein